MDQAAATLQAAPLTEPQRQHLLASHGSAALTILALIQEEPSLGEPLAEGLPILAAEAVYACRVEEAVSLADVLYLRTRLAALDTAAADRAADRVDGLMSRELGWDAAERHRQRAAYDALRALERPQLAG